MLECSTQPSDRAWQQVHTTLIKLVGRGKDDTLFALSAGAVQFGEKGGRRVVNIVVAA